MFTTQSHCEVGTIPQIHSRLLQEGFHVSESTPCASGSNRDCCPLSLPVTAPSSPTPTQSASSPGNQSPRHSKPEAPEM